MGYEFEIRKSYELLYKAHRGMYHAWIKYVLFSWHWWFYLVLTIVPWIIWIIFKRKNSTDRLLYAGLFAILATYVLDVTGVALGLWQYRYELLPLSPSIAPWDLTLIPVATMFTLQFNPLKLNRYLKAVIFALIASFIVEPLFSYLGYYILVNWKHIYSFPITALLYIIADWISRLDKFKGID